MKTQEPQTMEIVPSEQSLPGSPQPNPATPATKPKRAKLFRVRSFRSRLLSAMLLLVAFVSIAISVSVGAIGLDTGRKQVLNQLESVIILKEAQIDTWISELETSLGLIITSPEINEELLAQVGNNRSSENDLRQRLKFFQDRVTTLNEVFVVNQNGQIVFSTNSGQAGKYVTSETYFREAFEQDKENVQPPTYVLSLGELSFVSARPLKDRNGQTRGVLAGRANLKRLEEIMSGKTGLGSTGETYVVGSNRALLTSSRTAPQDKAIQGYVRAAGVDGTLKSKSKSSGLFNDSRGVPVVGVYHWYDKLQLVLVSEQEQIEAFSSIYTTLWLNIGIALFAILITVIVASAITINLSRPIVQLNKAALALETKNFEEDTNLAHVMQRGDELGQLGNTFNSMRVEIKNYTQNLENIVAERTFEVQQANREIVALNDRLKVDNKRLQAELDITRQLQQMILPREQELGNIRELEIAAFMQPAEEVGGDYYDVLLENGRTTIGIGDVTGHGLESGVLMIMVQTAVRTLISNNETDPVRFLTALNRTIYGNTQRMRSDKNLTLCILDYTAGILRIAGQHEELIVIRASGATERVDTANLGFPIGLEENISAWVAYTEVSLEPEDVVILYTDGITEAESPEGKLYGLDRLCEVAGEHRHKTAPMIKQLIIEDVLKHISTQTVFDDITLMVLKQR